MASITAYYTHAATGSTLYAFPVGQSLANWTTLRVALTEAAAPNLYRYSGTLSTTYPQWVVFSGASQPSGWDQAVSGVIDLTQIDILAGVSANVTVEVVQPVATNGQLLSPIVIGDDYLASNNRAFVWTIDEITGYSAGTAACYFGLEYGSNSVVVDGDVTDNGDGTWDLSFDVARTDTENLPEGPYAWSVEVRSASNVEITSIRGTCAVELVRKQTRGQA